MISITFWGFRDYFGGGRDRRQDGRRHALGLECGVLAQRLAPAVFGGRQVQATTARPTEASTRRSRPGR